MNFDNYKVGALVKECRGSQLMTIEKFYWDDIELYDDRFCDRIECSWFKDVIKYVEIFKYDEVELVN